MEMLKAGVIGVGYLGKFHAEKYAAMEGVELVGVSDVDRDVGMSIARKLNTKYFEDYRELAGSVQAVSIVVPTTLHYEVASTCLEMGIDVLVEKPMTSTLEEADLLISKAAERDLIIQVGHLERFNPAILAMEEHLTTPMFIESHRIHKFTSRGTDVDVVLDLMIHDIDIIMSMAGSPIKTVHTVGIPVVTPTTDIANARLIFENGCTANVTVSRISRDIIRRIRIFQPKSFISVDYAKKEITVIKLTGETGEDGLPKQETVYSCFIEKDALEAELRDFVRNVRTRTKPRVSGLEGRMALSVALQIMTQIREHAETHRHFFENSTSS